MVRSVNLTTPWSKPASGLTSFVVDELSAVVDAPSAATAAKIVEVLSVATTWPYLKYENDVRLCCEDGEEQASRHRTRRVDRP